MKKRCISLLMVCLLCVPMAQAGFTDVPADAWYASQLDALVSRGAITGYEDGRFAPDAPITVAEYIKILVSCTMPEAAVNTFGGDGGNWSDKYIRACQSLGVLEGFDASAGHLAKPITRNEAAWLTVAFARRNGETLAVPEGIERALRDYRSTYYTYQTAVGMAYGAGLISGYSNRTFGGESNLRRSEAVSIITRLLDPTQRATPVIPDYDYGAPVPQNAPVDDGFFADAVFIGDSLVDGFGAFSGLKQGTFMGVTSLNVFTVLAKGREQVFRTRTFGKIYVLLGINEIGYGTTRVINQYDTVLQRFRELQPTADIYVQSLLPVCEAKLTATERKNHVTNYYVREMNAALQQLCEKHGVYFVNVHEAFVDANGGLPASKCWDSVHLNVEGNKEWLAYLRTHTV